MTNSKIFLAVILLILSSLNSVIAQSNSKEDVAKRVEQNTPANLPQSPVAEKLKSDAEDNNLKGKVKSVIEEIQYIGKSRRERNSEDYYNEMGNYVKTISYMDGYPNSVAVWGYVDGNRVLKSKPINYAEGERPPIEGIKMKVESNLKNLNAPKDTGYSMKHKYRYNEEGQLIEKLMYTNNGELWSRDVYNYKGNQRESLNYGRDGSQWSQTIEILDKDENVIEQNLMDANSKVSDKNTFTYEFDAQGNWILQKAFENKKVKGKWIPKPWFIAYRTVTYYP